MKPVLTVSAFFVISACAFALVFSAGARSAHSEAQRIVKICSGELGHAECYEREIPRLLPSHSLESAFEVVRQVRAIDPAYQFCHVLAHKLGERIVAEDPERWVDAIPLNPADGLCSNGFIHGVLGGRFRAEVLDSVTLQKLIPDFTRACAPREGWNPTDLDTAICSHGMGHLYMFISDADIPSSLSLCENTMPEALKRVCREGVYMQIYQPLEPDDFLLIERMPVKPTKETVRSFCARYQKDEYEGACLRESWPFFREELKTGEGIAQFCSGQPNSQEEIACYEAALTLSGRFTLGDSSQALSLCGEVREPWRPMCYASGARAILEEDRVDGSKAITFCMNAPALHQVECLTSLADTANFIFGDTSEKERFCAQIPRELRMRCEARP
ncbi:MAG: hypothetical protein Athens041674_533 [Parcubacteria group bacterium Athens0416_74]|nr:MAG: hypothetical protein Athens041674_533 [Parcubacteria group bacterium Athens0416_74]